MLTRTALVALLCLTVVSEAASLQMTPTRTQLFRRQNKDGGNKQNGNNNNGGGGNNQLCLNSDAVQSASASTGQDGGEAEAGQVNSATDPANFINFCSGETLTNGQQIKGGSCNGVVMGKIPAVGQMVSSVIVNPKNFDNLAADQTFDISVNVANMQLGSFTNAQETYYSAPQDLNNQGLIIGHTHVTVQDVGNNLNPTSPLDAQKFVFFKGINNNGNGDGLVSATVTGGLPAGNYRVCTLSGASNHQPVLMPVAQRGAQDDCRYFSVGQNNGGGQNNNNNGGGNGGGGGGQQNDEGNDDEVGPNGTGQNNGNQGQGNQPPPPNPGQGQGNQGQGNQGQGNQGQGNQGQNNQGQNNQGQGNQGQGNQGQGNQGQGNQGQGNQGQGNQGQGNQGQGKSNPKSGGPGPGNKGSKANKGAGSSGTNGKKNNGGKRRSIGGISLPAITRTGNGFEVNGNTFTSQADAQQRACAIQNNACADAVNSSSAAGATVSDCNTQQTQCESA